MILLCHTTCLCAISSILCLGLQVPEKGQCEWGWEWCVMIPAPHRRPTVCLVFFSLCSTFSDVSLASSRSKLDPWDFPGGPVVKISLSNARGTGWISDQGAKIPYDLRPKNRNVKQKRYCHKLNKDFKHGPHQKILKQNKTKQKKPCFSRRNEPENSLDCK